MNRYVIETKQITKTYNPRSPFIALDHVDLHVSEGCIYGLIGDNGAGKSTLLKLLAGHIFPTNGELCLFGETEEKALCNIRKNIGCLIEYPCFVPGMTVEQTLHYYAIQKGVPDNKKIGEAIQLTGLSEKQHAKCKTLSLGQKQRLGLAVALLGEPQILILDEPINGLDPSGIVEFRSILQQLNEQKNITILLSSHILSELQHLATVYGFLNKGILLEEISSEALHAKCANCIELTVSDAEKYTVLLEKIFPEENYKVLYGTEEKRCCKMLNFIKSEYYRMIHTTGIRVFFGILSVLTILLISGISIVETQYHTTSFSYSILVSSPMFFTLMGMLTASVLYEDSKRNGIIKNSIANGIPRGKVFFSQCIVSITTATVIMTIVLTLWIFMTELFLDKTGPVHMTDLLMEIPAIYLIAVSSIVLTIVLCLCFQNGAFIFFTWLFVFFIFPTILLKFGIAVSAHFKTDFIYNIAMWMPSNFFQINTANVNMSSCITAWDTTGGMLRCIIAGISGIIIFMAIGFRHIRKADL